jgi:hypothetical protein
VSQVLLILGRLVIIFAGYLAASLAASAFLNLLAIGTLDIPSELLPDAMRGSFMVAVPLLAMFVAWLAFTPAFVFMVIAELAGKRDWLFHAIGGGIVAAVVTVGYFWQPAGPGDWTSGNTAIALALIGGGLVGGIAYWAVAGRMAGGWRGTPRGSQSDP